MKSIDFFINKANSYIEIINKVSPTLISEYAGGFDGSPELDEQHQNLSDLYLKIRLLFAEFDKGEIFYSQVKDLYEDNLSRHFISTENKLSKLKHILEIFIVHLKEFRE